MLFFRVLLLFLLSAGAQEIDRFFFTQCECVAQDGVFASSDTTFIPFVEIDPESVFCPAGAKRGIIKAINDNQSFQGTLDGSFFEDPNTGFNIRFEFIIQDPNFVGEIPMLRIGTPSGDIVATVVVADGELQVSLDGAVQSVTRTEVSETFNAFEIAGGPFTNPPSTRVCLETAGENRRCRFDFSNPLSEIDVTAPVPLAFLSGESSGEGFIQISTLLFVKATESVLEEFQTLALPVPKIFELDTKEDTLLQENFLSFLDVEEFPFELAFEVEQESLRGEFLQLDENGDFQYLPAVNDNELDSFVLEYTNLNEADLPYKNCSLSFELSFILLPVVDRLEAIEPPLFNVTATFKEDISLLVASSPDFEDFDFIVQEGFVEILTLPLQGRLSFSPCNDTEYILIGDLVDLVNGSFDFCYEPDVSMALDSFDSFVYRVLPENLEEELATDNITLEFLGSTPVTPFIDATERVFFVDEDAQGSFEISRGLFFDFTSKDFNNFKVEIEELPDPTVGRLLFNNVEVLANQAFNVGDVLDFIPAANFFNSNGNGGDRNAVGEKLFPQRECSESIDNVCPDVLSYNLRLFSLETNETVVIGPEFFNLIVRAVDDEETFVLFTQQAIPVVPEDIIDGFGDFRLTTLAFASDLGQNVFNILLRIVGDGILLQFDSDEAIGVDVIGFRNVQDEVTEVDCSLDFCDVLQVSAIPRRVNSFLVNNLLLRVDSAAVRRNFREPSAQIFVQSGPDGLTEPLVTVSFSAAFLLEPDEETNEEVPLGSFIGMLAGGIGALIAAGIIFGLRKEILTSCDKEEKEDGATLDDLADDTEVVRDMLEPIPPSIASDEALLHSSTE